MAIKIVDNMAPAGVILGGLSQDPLENPMSGIAGMAIGAALGSSIKPVIIGNVIAPAQTSSVVSSMMGFTEEEFEKGAKYYGGRIYSGIQRLDEMIGDAVNRSDAISQAEEVFLKLYNESYKSNPDLSYLKMFEMYKKSASEEEFVNMVEELKLEDKSLSRTVSSISLMGVERGPVEKTLKNGKIVKDKRSHNASVISRYSKIDTTNLPGHMTFPQKETSISASTSKENKEKLIRDHLINNLNTPGDIAERQAKNIAEFTDGQKVSLTDDKIRVTANGEIATMRLDRYTADTGFDNPVVTDGKELSVSNRYNPFMSTGDGVEVPNIAVIERRGGTQSGTIEPVVKVNKSSDILRTQAFSPIEAALFEAKFTGRSMSAVFKDYNSKVQHVGNFQELISMNKGTVDIGNLLLSGHKTDISRQSYRKRAGNSIEVKYRDASFSELQDINTIADIDSVNLGFARVSQGIKNSEISTLSLGVKEVKHTFDFTTHSERATDSQNNRGHHGFKPNIITEKIVDELKTDPRYSGFYDNATLLRVDSVESRPTSIADALFPKINVALGDGQVLLRRSSIKDVTVAETWAAKLGNVQDGNILLEDSRSGEMISKLIDEYKTNGKMVRSGGGVVLRSGERIAIDTEGRPVNVPERFTEFTLKNVMKNEAGDIVATGVGIHRPADEAGSVKLFGDVKATSVILPDKAFEAVVLTRKLEDVGMLDLKTMHIDEGLATEMGIGQSIAEYLKKARSMSKDAIRDLAGKLNVDTSTDILALGDSVKLTTSFREVPNTPAEARRFAIDAISNISGDDNNDTVKNMLKRHIDGASDQDVVGKAKGVMVAIAGLTDSKSSRILSASIAISEATKSAGVNDLDVFHGYTNVNEKIIANTLFDLSENKIAAEGGSTKALSNMIDMAVNFGEYQYNKNGDAIRLYSPSSPSFGVEGNMAIGKTNMSWMRMQTLHNMGFTTEDISQLATFRKDALYEVKSKISSEDVTGFKLEDVFGEDADQQRRIVNKLFDPAEDRLEVAKKMLSPESIDGGIVNISLGKKIGNTASVPINLFSTNRSGSIHQGGLDLIPEKDRVAKEIILRKISYDESMKSGDIEAANLEMKRIEKSVEHLEDVYRRMSKNISKEARGATAKHGSDMLYQTIGGLAESMHKDALAEGYNIVFVNKEGLKHLGVNIDVDNPDHFYSPSDKFKRYNDAGLKLVTTGDDRNIPLIGFLGREPNSGEQTVQSVRYAYAPALDSYKNVPVVALPEYALSLAEKYSISAGATLGQDADGDTLSLVSAKYAETDLINKMRESEKNTSKMLLANADLLSALSPKTSTKAPKLAIGPGVESRSHMSSKMLQGQERKHMAPQIVELANAIDTAINMQYRQEKAVLLEKYGTESQGKTLTPEMQARFEKDLEGLNKKRFASSLVSSAFVENTIKAIHSGGSIGTEPAIEIINRIRDYSTSVSGKGYGEVSQYIHQSLVDMFKASAIEVDLEKQVSTGSAGTTQETLMEAADFIKKSFSNYGLQISENTNQQLTRKGKKKDQWRGVVQTVDGMNPANATLPQGALNDIIPEGIDIKSSIISTLSENKGRVAMGIGGLAAASFILGSESPDMSSPMNNSPVARQSNALPPMREQTGYVTSQRSSSGSVSIAGRQFEYNHNSNLINLINGGDSVRSTVRFENSQGY